MTIQTNKVVLSTHRFISSILFIITFLLWPGIASGQYVFPVYTPEEGKGSLNPELKQAGNNLKMKFENKKNKLEKNYIVILLQEESISYLELNNIEGENFIRFKTYMLKNFKIDDVDFTAGFYHTETHKVDYDKSLIDGTATFETLEEARKEGGHLWETALYDGKNEYHWANAESAALHSQFLPEYLGSGLPDDPFTSKLSGWTGGYPQLKSDILTIPYQNFLVLAYERFLGFASTGRVTENMQINLEKTKEDYVNIIDFTLEHAPSSYTKGTDLAVINWKAMVKNGFPIKYSQDNKHSNGLNTFLTHFWHIGKIKLNDTEQIDFPTAWEELNILNIPFTRKNKHDPNDASNFTSIGVRKRFLVLHAELGKEAVKDHPALAPDTLADWLGVSLRWENSEGCRVESHPKDATKNLGVPHCKTLEEIKDKIKKGEIKIEWPFEKEGPEQPQ